MVFFGYIIIDDDLMVRSCDSSFLRHFGYSAEEVCGKSFVQVLHPDYLENFRQISQLGTEKTVFLLDSLGSYKPMKMSVVESFVGDQGMRGYQVQTAEEQLPEDPKVTLDGYFHNTTDVYLKCDFNLNILYISENIEKLAGYKQAEVIGTDLLKKMSVGDRALDSLTAQLRQKGFVENSDTFFTNKDGSVWWGALSLSACSNDCEPEICYEGFLRDISKYRKKYFQIANERTERYKTIFESTLDAVFILSPETYKILEVNKRAAQLAGLSESLLRGMHVSIIPDDGDLDTFMGVIDMAKNNPGEESVGTHNVISYGRRSPVEVRAKLIRSTETEFILIIIRDITEKAEVERKLYENEAIYKNITEKLFPDGLVFLKGDKIVDVSETFEKEWGYRKSEIVGKSALNYILPEYRQAAVESFRKKRVSIENVGIRHDGTLIQFEAIITKVGGVEDESLMVIALRNIGEQKEQERILIHQSRLAVMGEMLSNIAHQWRQPISTLAGILINMEMRKDLLTLDDEKLSEMISDGNMLLKYMSNTIDDFKNFFMPEKMEETFCVNDQIKKTLKMIEASLSFENINVEINENCDVTTVGYPNEYSQVILNILNNAKDIFSVRNVSNPHISINVERGVDGRSRVCISDNGGGVVAEPPEIIFEPYYTFGKSSNSLGIGLYMSKSIIEKNMKGELGVFNNGKGASFIVVV